MARESAADGDCGHSHILRVVDKKTAQDRSCCYRPGSSSCLASLDSAFLAQMTKILYLLPE